MNTVAAIMREQGMVARPKRHRRHSTRPGEGRRRAPDLVKRKFAAQQLNGKWYGDGTEVDPDEGKLQLDSVLDVASRRIVGFAIGEHHDAELAYGALSMAVAVRGGKQEVRGVIFHTDQGSEFTAKTFRAACRRCGIRQSMGRPGSALDNAVIESWHSTLEFELRMLEHFDTKVQTRHQLVAWIEDYNADRRHSALNMRSPLQHEQQLRDGRAQPGQQPGQDVMSASRPGNGQYGGILAGVKAKPSGWPTASLATGCGPPPPGSCPGQQQTTSPQDPYN